MKQKLEYVTMRSVAIAHYIAQGAPLPNGVPFKEIVKGLIETGHREVILNVDRTPEIGDLFMQPGRVVDRLPICKDRYVQLFGEINYKKECNND